MLVKCNYCRERVRPNRLGAHEKHCPEARKARKRLASNKIPPEAVEVPEVVDVPKATPPEPPGEFVCDVCNKRLKTASGLAGHKRSHKEKS